MASDFHTHVQGRVIRSLVSSTVLLPASLTSLEIHPWQLPENFSPALLPDSEKLHSFSAIGEIGLDKLRGPSLPVQERYLREILTLAADTGKPVVLHAVRTYQEIFAILKDYPVKAMVHGFRSSPEMLDELWRKKITVSFHPAAAENPVLMNKLHHAKGMFGFESDDRKDIDVCNIITAVSEKFSLPALEQITDQNFADFLEI